MGTMISYYDVSINKYFSDAYMMRKQIMSQILVRSKDNETSIFKTNNELVYINTEKTAVIL